LEIRLVYNSGRIKDQNEADNVEAETLYMTEAVDIKGKSFRDNGSSCQLLMLLVNLSVNQKKNYQKVVVILSGTRLTKKEAIEAIEAT